MTTGAPFQLCLLGAFRFTGADGKRIEIPSRRGIAMLAMLAMAKNGERTRAWLQAKLWSQRNLSQAQNSLRRELANLRKTLNQDGRELLEANRRHIRLNLDLVHVDARDGNLHCLPSPLPVQTGEFLEGFDLAGEEAFEDWLLEERAFLANNRLEPADNHPDLSHGTVQKSYIVAVGLLGDRPCYLPQNEIQAIAYAHDASIRYADNGDLVAQCTSADQAVAFATSILSRGIPQPGQTVHDFGLQPGIGIGYGEITETNNALSGRAVIEATELLASAKSGGIVMASSVQQSLVKVHLHPAPKQTEIGIPSGGPAILAAIYHPEDHAYALSNTQIKTVSPITIGQLDVAFTSRPALAVLPLENVTRDEKNAYIAEGISDELINYLSRLRWLPIIARLSSFSLNHKLQHPQDIGRQLGAKYVVQGQLRCIDQQIKITVHLIAVENGHTLLTHPINLPADHSQASIEELLTELVAALETRIDRNEQIKAKNAENWASEPHDLIWRGRWHLHQMTHRDSEIAASLFKQVLELQPDSAEALIQSTFCLGWTIWATRMSEPQIRQMRDMAQRAIVADADDGRGHMLAGIAEMWMRKPIQARALLQRAVALNPSLSLAHAFLGGSYNLSADGAVALPPLQTSLRLSPNDVFNFYTYGEMAMAHCLLRNWSDAVLHADLALNWRPVYWYAHMVKITALVEMDKQSTAHQAYQELLAYKPDFSEKNVQLLPFLNPSWNDYFLYNLNQAAQAPVEWYDFEQKKAAAFSD